MTGQIDATTCRGQRRNILLSNRLTCHYENGMRAVPVSETVRNIERFFLKSPVEIQFAYSAAVTGILSRAVLKYHSPVDKSLDQYYYGKGITTRQHMASACIEFFERYCATRMPDDLLLTASFDEASAEAINPLHFTLPSGTGYHTAKNIEWIWGYSLSRKEPVLVPANLVYYPYEGVPDEKHIARSDTNGLAAGNNMEEAVLHGIFELIERDQVTISEYNRLPVKRIIPDSLPAACLPLLGTLNEKGFEVYIYCGTSDLPFPFITVFLRLRKDHTVCSVSSGTHLDPVIALERALTEAVQLLPPVVNFEGWFNSGAPQFYTSGQAETIHFDSLKNYATKNIKENIETCLSFLESVTSEVIAVDLSRPDIPFPVVRILATRLQPILHKGHSQRISPRFFEVPDKLGMRSDFHTAEEINIWPVCGYR